jgi:hypothetical protein
MLQYSVQIIVLVAKWLTHRFAKPTRVGSNPTQDSRAPARPHSCPGGGIGRHEGLKIPCLSNGVRVQFPPRAQNYKPQPWAGVCGFDQGIEKLLR